MDMKILHPFRRAASRSTFTEAHDLLPRANWLLVAVASLISFACSSDPSDSGGTGTTGNGGAASSTGTGTSTANVGGATSIVSSNVGGAANVGGSDVGTSGGATGVSSGAGAFSLLFRDDFETLDTKRWKLMTHSWEGNLAKFAAKSASVADGELSIALLEAPAGTVDGGETKPYLGAEVRSVATLKYGRVRARAKFAQGSAVVSALVTIYTPWPADNWNELDIECLGKEPSSVQFNTMVYTGTLPAASTPVSPTQQPHNYDLGFDSSADYHVYQIEWTPSGVVFSVDDKEAYTWNKRIGLMTLPQNVLLTIWASSSSSWAGAVDDTTLGAKAVYDWIELYEYTP
jgi:hypothetical protein